MAAKGEVPWAVKTSTDRDDHGERGLSASVISNRGIRSKQGRRLVIRTPGVHRRHDPHRWPPAMWNGSAGVDSWRQGWGIHVDGSKGLEFQRQGFESDAGPIAAA